MRDPARTGWTPQVPFFLRSVWGGVGAWLGAVTVVGLAAFVFNLTLADVARESRSSDPALNDEGALGIDVGGGIGASSGEQRASRARTTGELTDGASSAFPATGESGRSSGPAEGLDLDLGYRSGGDPAAGTSPATTSGASDPVDSTADPIEPTNVAPAEIGGTMDAGSSTTATTAAISFPGHELSTTTAPPTIAEAEVDVGWLGSVPLGSTSVPEPGTLPAPVTVHPSGTVPPPGPPTSRFPSTTPTRPSVSAVLPTTRRPVPADTRPSQGVGQGHGRGRNQDSPGGTAASNGSNGSNGRAVGRLR
ncbi:MAG: hypothetical protein OES24_23210 [Acidimicrobiia bacterium]|nr:hypothetical protein [Acidimicrobiia bacterium]